MHADRGFHTDAAAPMSLELPVSTRSPNRPRGSERELPPAPFPCRAVTAILYRSLRPGPQWLSWPCVGLSRQTARYFYPANGSCHPWLQPERKKPAGREQSLTTHQPELLLPAVCHPSVTCPRHQPRGALASVSGASLASPGERSPGPSRLVFLTHKPCPRLKANYPEKTENAPRLRSDMSWSSGLAL